MCTAPGRRVTNYIQLKYLYNNMTFRSNVVSGFPEIVRDSWVLYISMFVLGGCGLRMNTLSKVASDLLGNSVAGRHHRGDDVFHGGSDLQVFPG